MKEANHTCFDIANYFLNIARDSGSCISNLKLQKLVYYAQAWHLANFQQPLIKEDFQAWIHGPVVYELWRKYRKYKWHPITEESDSVPRFPRRTKELLEEVSQVYMPCDAYALELMTHRENPWIEARNGLAPDENGSSIISKDSMRDYYQKRIA